MKPYSKKYLTLALAGVLAASIPVSAFAEGTAPNPSAEKSNTPTATDTTTPGAGEHTTNPDKGKTQDQIAKEEAERKAKEAEDKAKE